MASELAVTTKICPSCEQPVTPHGRLWLHEGGYLGCQLKNALEDPAKLILLSGIAVILRDHYPTTGMKVSMGETCACGYWTGGEDEREAGRPRGIYGLQWHQTQLIAEMLQIKTVGQ